MLNPPPVSGDVAAYVMKQMELPYDQALDFVMRRRWISPNQGASVMPHTWLCLPVRVGCRAPLSAQTFCMALNHRHHHTGFVIQLKQYEARLGYNAKKKPVLMYCN